MALVHNGRIDALAVIANADTQLLLVVANLYLNMLRTRVSNRIAHGLGGNSEGFIADNRI
jgi:hypothetical protein